MDFAIPVNHRVKSEGRQNARQISEPCQRAEKVVEHKCDGDINRSCTP